MRTHCEDCSLLLEDCPCPQPVSVVAAAVTDVMMQIDGPLRHTSLHTALLTEALLARGCEIAGKRRIDTYDHH